MPFDHLPVQENGQYVGLLSLFELRNRPSNETSGDNKRVVRQLMQRLSEDCLISAETGLLSFLVEADRAPCRLVVSGKLDSNFIPHDNFRLGLSAQYSLERDDVDDNAVDSLGSTDDGILVGANR